MSKNMDKTINRHGDSRDTKTGPKPGGRRPRNMGSAHPQVGRETQGSSAPRPRQIQEAALRVLASMAAEVVLADKLANKPAGTVEAKCLDIAVRQLNDSDRQWVVARAELTDSERDLVGRMVGNQMSYWMRIMKRDSKEALRIFRLNGRARMDALQKWMQLHLG